MGLQPRAKDDAQMRDTVPPPLDDGKPAESSSRTGFGYSEIEGAALVSFSDVSAIQAVNSNAVVCLSWDHFRAY